MQLHKLHKGKAYNKISRNKETRSENSQGRNEREGKCSQGRYSRQPWREGTKIKSVPGGIDRKNRE